MGHVAEADGEPFPDLQQLAVAHRAEMLNGVLGVLHGKQRLHQSLAGPLVLTVLVFGFALVDLGAVNEHDPAQIAGLSSGVDRSVKALLEQQRQMAGVVYVRVRQQHEVQLSRRNGERLIFINVLSLFHAAVHQTAAAGALDQRTTAGDLMVGAQKGDFHGHSPMRTAGTLLRRILI